ncbi:DUF4255 domain-containing protein [Streptomyces sp. NPDC057638]|uniref:DUF4255 domain-containing protein n=1 Tax=Streptomyces sp. NPDC057638 TaxID=3346190 RepID=UPI00368921F4
MIHEVDEGLRLLLQESGLGENGVEVVFEAPTREWAARRNAPTVSVYLYGIHEDMTRRQSGAAEVHDTEGQLVAWRTPPRWFALTYMVTAWTNRPQDEHRLLSRVLLCLTRSDSLPARLYTGSLAALGLTVTLDAAGESAYGTSVADVWSALDGELKASVDLRVTAPLAADQWTPGPPVTEGLLIRSSATGEAPATPADGAPAGPGRRLRYQGIADPGPEGFAGPRERNPAPGSSARRRRGGPAR